MTVDKITEHKNGSATVFMSMTDEEAELFRGAVKAKTPIIFGEESYFLVKSKKNNDYTLKKIKTKKKGNNGAITKKKKRS